MAEWRCLRGWSDAELAARLEALEELPLDFDTYEALTVEGGWNQVRSQATIARELPGAPGETFRRVWRAVSIFEHSDPRIVVAHFRVDVPLERRRMLLELRVLGLRFLCPVRVGTVLEERGGAGSRRGFTIETLEGHIERGRELFLLEKDHATGEIHFRIEAAWRAGDFPNAWSRAGFELLGRRYQRTWHRLAHLRLRRFASGQGVHLMDEEIAHEGHALPMKLMPSFFTQRGLDPMSGGRDEQVGRDSLWFAGGLGALSGVRSLVPPALVARSLDRGRGSLLVPFLMLLAGGELIADKLPIPPRTSPFSLVGRAASGAIVGGLSARRGDRGDLAALVGASAAVISTFVSGAARLRAQRGSHALGWAVASAEDALVIWAGARLAAAAARR